jgi:cellulose synthase operon protein C
MKLYMPKTAPTRSSPTYHDDEPSLARAEVIARRLRGLDAAAFQDTYGWIALRRGNLDEALAHLEPAAKGLPDDLLTQYHLGMLYDKLGRKDDAIAQLGIALKLSAKLGETVAQPQMAIARDTLKKLKGDAP